MENNLKPSLEKLEARHDEDAFTIEEFSIQELEDRLEFLECCNANCSC